MSRPPDIFGQLAIGRDDGASVGQARHHGSTARRPAIRIWLQQNVTRLKLNRDVICRSAPDRRQSATECWMRRAKISDETIAARASAEDCHSRVGREEILQRLSEDRGDVTAV